MILDIFYTQQVGIGIRFVEVFFTKGYVELGVGCLEIVCH